jgi:hypothetical protein
MNAIDLLGTAHGESDAVKAHRVIAAHIEELVQGHGLGHVILGMHLDEPEFGSGRGDLRHMRRAQADTRAAVRGWSLRGHDRDPARRRVSSF